MRFSTVAASIVTLAWSAACSVVWPPNDVARARRTTPILFDRGAIFLGLDDIVRVRVGATETAVNSLRWRPAIPVRKPRPPTRFNDSAHRCTRSSLRRLRGPGSGGYPGKQLPNSMISADVDGVIPVLDSLWF